MTYDDWKLETPEDEFWRKTGKVFCEDCEIARATTLRATPHGPVQYFLCERCAEKRDCPGCGGFGTEFVEDLTGHGKDEWLCVACMDAHMEAIDAAEALIP